MTKDQVNALIDRLADKTLSFGCEVRRLGVNSGHPILVIQEMRDSCWVFDDMGIDKLPTHEDWNYEILGHPILLGDVLEKIRLRSDEIIVLSLWEKNGYSKSLQQIVEESGWMDCGCGVAENEFYLKSPEANALFEYLDELFPLSK
jgi:hypothetical protein